ncbi:sulfotransferase [Dokdonella sp.]|uniref:tetratricopeptide repeat-containing sulfotransferase family protein n=1 Tax=Dokdonella sp. TaxID=2291710 RepID=UPI001B1146F4|nr:sulfotransferase [Dokdonella sp.]MBO9663341.1 sulfotransferase [Dokdonella sp.]
MSIDVDVATWLDRAAQAQENGELDEACSLLRQAISAAPQQPMIRVKLADALLFRGDVAAAAGEYRAALRLQPRCGPAWWGLAGIRTERLEADELARLETLAGDATLAEPDRIAVGFALAKALEDERRYADAYAMLLDANARQRRRIDWSANDFVARVERMLGLFTPDVAGAAPAELGREVIFVVSLPRSGSTLTEQILAAHPQVEGASELGDLGAVIAEESNRRREKFPDWALRADSADWSRLGRRYLERTARWRRQRPRSTDKMPNNWLYLGAALAMLPGACVIDCRRDPLEIAWSCFRQLFSQGAPFAYDFDDLAAYAYAYDRAMRHWRALFPQRIRTQSYEALLADPEAEIRALLAFCGLPFDRACLDFHSAARAVRTASAAQVRQPLRGDTARGDRYGHLLDPLREALRRAQARR